MSLIETKDFFDKTKCMPFDSKGLTLLPYLNVSPRLRENILPLWSMDNLQLRNEDCYYEFEVIESENTTNCDKFSNCTDSSYTESDVRDCGFEREMCHICNTEVPTVGMSEHLSSSKHRTFSRIAEISLERVKKQIGVSYPSGKLPAGFVFCSSCVDLVPEGDLSQHRTSKSHRNAQLVDQLLSDLLRIYSDGSDGSDGANKGESASAPSKAASSSTKGSSWNHSGKFANASTNKLMHQGDSVDNGKTGSIEPNAATGKIDTGKIILDEAEATVTVTVDSEKDKSETAVVGNKNGKPVSPVKKDLNRRIINCLGVDLKEYVRGINTDGRFGLDVVDCGLVVEANGVRARVELEGFHALSALGKRHVMCGLCKTISRHLDNHIHSQPHLDKLALPIDRNFIREMDDDKGHCILCNDTVENPDVHALCSKEHETKLNLSLIPYETDFENAAKTDESTKATERKEPAGNDPANDARKMSPERGSTAKKEGPEIPVEKVSTNVTGPTANKEGPEILVEKVSTNVTGPTATKEGPEIPVEKVSANVTGGNVDEIICTICFISIGPDGIESHERSPEHSSNESLAVHHLLEYSSTHMTFKCKVCLTGFPVHMKLEHVTSPFHQNNYKKLLAANTMTRSAHSVFCDTCVAYIRIGDELAHITSKTHITLTVNVLACDQSEIAAARKKANEHHYCAVCSKYVPGDAKNLRTHENGAHHRKKLALLEAAKGKGCNDKTPAQKPVAATPEAVVPVPKAAVPQKAIAPAPKTIDPLNAPQRTTTRELIKATANAAVVECKVCSTTLPSKPSALDEHFKGYAHMKNAVELVKAGLKLHDDIYWCVRCDACVPLGGQFQHSNDDQHRENTTKSLADEAEGKQRPQQLDSLDLDALKSTENKGATRCRLCDVLVPGSGSTLRMHFAGRKHLTQLAAFLAENSMSEKAGQLVCDICGCSVPRSGLFQHVANFNHTFRKTALRAAAKLGNVIQNVQDHLGKSPEAGGGEKRVEASDKPGAGEGKSNSNGKFRDDVKDAKASQREAKEKEEAVKATKTNEHAFSCGVCNVQLTAGEMNLSVHNDGARHKSNLALMAQNRVRVVDGGCYCEACDTTFSHDLLQQHTATMQHLVMLG